MNRKCFVFTAAPDLTVSFLITNCQSGPFPLFIYLNSFFPFSGKHSDWSLSESNPISHKMSWWNDSFNVIVRGNCPVLERTKPLSPIYLFLYSGLHFREVALLLSKFQNGLCEVNLILYKIYTITFMNIKMKISCLIFLHLYTCHICYQKADGI